METEVKYCKMCRKALPPLSDREYCYACEELLLFDKVREFVRNNDVNEYQVAEYFMSNYCSRCGQPVSFGTLCPQCLRLLNGEKARMIGFSKPEEGEEGEMRFLDGERK